MLTRKGRISGLASARAKFQRKQAEGTGSRNPHCSAAQELPPVVIDDFGIVRRQHGVLLSFRGWRAAWGRTIHFLAR